MMTTAFGTTGLRDNGTTALGTWGLGDDVSSDGFQPLQLK